MRKLCYFQAVSLFAVIASGVVAHSQSLAPPPSATGKIVGPDSKPQAGVPLEVTGPEGRTTAFTDQNGQWSLYNLRQGNYRVKPLGGSTAPGQATANFTIKGWFDGPKYTYDAGEMKLNRSWQQY